MTIRLVPAIVCYDSRLHFLNLHHVPHLSKTIFLLLSAQSYVLPKGGLATGRDLKKMLNILLYCVRHMNICSLAVHSENH